MELHRPGTLLMPLIRGTAKGGSRVSSFSVSSYEGLLAAIEESALAARRDGLLETVDGHIRPTPRGRRFLNRLLAGFLI